MRGDLAQFFELLDSLLFPTAAPEDICVVGQRLYLALGPGGLTGEFYGLLVVANLQVELRLAFTRHFAGFVDLFFELVAVLVRGGLAGEEFGSELVDGLDAAI